MLSAFSAFFFPKYRSAPFSISFLLCDSSYAYTVHYPTGTVALFILFQYFSAELCSSSLTLSSAISHSLLKAHPGRHSLHALCFFVLEFGSSCVLHFSAGISYLCTSADSLFLYVFGQISNSDFKVFVCQVQHLGHIRVGFLENCFP